MPGRVIVKRSKCMKTMPEEIVSVTASSVLFIGNPSEALLNPEVIDSFDCHVHENMLDAIKLLPGYS